MSVGESSIIGAREAKTRFSELLDRAISGEQITITRHGSPVARLIPIQMSHTPDQRAQAVQQMRRLAESHRLDGLRVKDLIAEGRKT